MVALEAGRSAQQLINYMRGTVGGARLGDVTAVCKNDLVAASGTVTFAAGGSGNYTVLVNGVTTGNVAWDTDEETTAAAVYAALVALTNNLVDEQVTFSLDGAVITVTAKFLGLAGNAVTLTCTGTNATASGSGRLTGGTSTDFSLSF